ncbi:MAG: glycosyltransferase family 2 protein [Pyrinomonadaceae bacterium]
MLVFYFFAAIVIFLGVTSLLGGLRFSKYVRRELTRAEPQFTPFISVIAPCRGLEEGLRENLDAILAQNYPAYEVLFVSGQADDPGLKTVREASESISASSIVTARIVVAGEASDSGQKVHNLRMAVREANTSSQVFVFVDTDARPHANWLRSLVVPLGDQFIGATTGYRWFVPAGGGLTSQLRSVWNASIASALGENGDKNFCWGGSTAISRGTFEKLNVSERWRGSVSDDFTLMRILREAKLPIRFVPACLIASFGDCGFSELLEFTTRQLKITRVYAPHFWRSVLLGSLLFGVVFFGGIGLVVSRAASGQPYLLPLTVLLMIFGLGSAKSLVRSRAVSLVLANYQLPPRHGWLAHTMLWPLTSLLYLYNAMAAAFSRRIKWRGITYQLNSPTEAVIISREP